MSPSNLEILAYETTPLAMLCLRRRELLSRPGTVITEITLDHELLMSSYHTASECALADEAIARHTGRELSVLVGGLGLGYTANQVLDSERVRRVEVIEFLPEVIGFLRDGLVPLSTELLADPRFAVHQGLSTRRSPHSPMKSGISFSSTSTILPTSVWAQPTPHSIPRQGSDAQSCI